MIARADPVCINKNMGHYNIYCKDCRSSKACADIYHITPSLSEAADCSATDLAVFESMFHHLLSGAYGLPESDKSNYCVQTNDIEKASNKALLLYYQWGPSCNDGETFEMYRGGSSGFCYCGSNCDKSYSNPPLNTLLTTLAVIIGMNILFNAFVLFMRAHDSNTKTKNTISTTGIVGRTKV